MKFAVQLAEIICAREPVFFISCLKAVEVRLVTSSVPAVFCECPKPVAMWLVINTLLPLKQLGLLSL